MAIFRCTFLVVATLKNKKRIAIESAPNVTYPEFAWDCFWSRFCESGQKFYESRSYMRSSSGLIRLPQLFRFSCIFCCRNVNKKAKKQLQANIFRNVNTYIQTEPEQKLFEVDFRADSNAIICFFLLVETLSEFDCDCFLLCFCRNVNTYIYIYI